MEQTFSLLSIYKPCDMGGQFYAYKGQEGDKAGEEDSNIGLEA